MIDTDLLIATKKELLKEKTSSNYSNKFMTPEYLKLQGHYGRTLSDLAQIGLINLK